MRLCRPWPSATRGKLGSNDVFNPGFPGLLTHNITDRETYSYRGLYVDVARAVDTIRGLPEVDASRMAVTGGSQAAPSRSSRPRFGRTRSRPLRRRCHSCAASVEAAELSVWWPYREITDYLRAHPDARAAVEATTAYFDVYNLAPLVRRRS